MSMPQQPVIALFNQIVATREQPPSSPFINGEFKEADNSALEKQIDQMGGQAHGHCPYNGLTCLRATHRQAPKNIALVEGMG